MSEGPLDWLPPVGAGGPTQVPLAFLVYRLTASPAPEAHPATQSLDEKLWDYVTERTGRLEEDIERAARTFFGPAVGVDVSVSPGSVELAVLVTAFGALASYRAAVENVQWFVSHVRGLISRFMTDFSRQNRATVQVLPARFESAAPSPGYGQEGGSMRPFAIEVAVLAYIVVTQAGLLAILGWLLVTKL